MSKESTVPSISELAAAMWFSSEAEAGRSPKMADWSKADNADRLRFINIATDLVGKMRDAGWGACAVAQLQAEILGLKQELQHACAVVAAFGNGDIRSIAPRSPKGANVELMLRCESCGHEEWRPYVSDLHQCAPGKQGIMRPRNKALEAPCPQEFGSKFAVVSAEAAATPSPA